MYPPPSTVFLFIGFQHGLRLTERLFVIPHITSEPQLPSWYSDHFENTQSLAKVLFHIESFLNHHNPDIQPEFNHFFC